MLRTLGSSVALVLALTVMTASAVAQSLAGDYLLSVDGQAILSLMLRQDETGRLTGTVSSAGKQLPLSGMVRGQGGVFVSSAPDGSRLHWEVAPQGAGLAVVMAPSGLDGQADPALAQRHVLLRGQPGGGGLARGSQRWIARLATAADSIVSWCSSPMYAESDLCVNAMQVLRKVAPALMVARFATSGQAGSLMRVLAQGPGAMSPGAAPPMGGDDSFLTAVDPELAESDTGVPPPDEYVEPPPDVADPVPVAPQTTGVPTLAQSLLGGGTVAGASGGVSGDWVMLHAGSELLRVRLHESGGGVTGTLTLLGTPFPLTGTASGGGVSFTTRSARGGVGSWRGSVAGDRLILTLTTAAGSERYDLSRQGAGWSDAGPLAKEWDGMLRGKVLAHTAGARDPATGRAVETMLHFCAEGVLRLEIAGAGGEVQPAWRIVASGDQAAVELSAPEGTIQIGLGRVSGSAMVFAGQPARLTGASASCR